MIHAIALLAVAFSPDCRPDGDIASARLYRVLPGTRAAFHRTADCADAGCEEGTYVVPGDRVVVYRRDGRRSCALFAGTRATVGWLDSDRLTPDTAASHPALAAWIGDWHDGDDHIRLTRAGSGRLRVDGEAYWPGAHPIDRPAGPNVGSLDRTVDVHVDRIDYSDGDDPSDCRATLRLLGHYLLVDDNGSCGGNNVRFTGLYRRRSAHRPATKS